MLIIHPHSTQIVTIDCEQQIAFADASNAGYHLDKAIPCHFDQLIFVKIAIDCHLRHLPLYVSVVFCLFITRIVYHIFTDFRNSRGIFQYLSQIDIISFS